MRKKKNEKQIQFHIWYRLRDGIVISPQNWINCTMFVQDCVRFDTNITAEISTVAVENFQQMCQKYAKKF